MKAYFSNLFLKVGIISLLFLSLESFGQGSLNSKLKYVSETIIQADLGDAVVKGKLAFSWPNVTWFNRESKKIHVYNLVTKKVNAIKVKGKWHKIYASGNSIIDVADIGINNKLTLYNFDNDLWNVDSSWVTKHDIGYAFYGDGVLKLGSFYVDEPPFLEVDKNRFYLDGFTHEIMLHMRPKAYIDFLENVNLICDPSKYQITLLNNDLSVRETITYVDSGFLGINKDLYMTMEAEYVKNSPANSFSDLRKLEQTSDNVWSVQFINDTAIWVKRTTNFGGEDSHLKMVYDIWVNDGGWKLKVKGMVDEKSFENDIIGSDCLSFKLGEYGCRHFFENGKLYVLKIEIPENVQGMNYGAFEKKNNDWFFDNPLSFKLYEYEIVL